MTSEDRLFVSFDFSPTHRYFVAAWMFLEDAVQRANRETNPSKRVFQLQRLLGPCALNLRMACEAQFGTGNLSKAPDASLMYFVTAARHIGVHVVENTGRGAITAASAQWDNEIGAGTIELEVVLEIDVGETDLSDAAKAQARRYLSQHGDDVFLALHSAAETIAGWLGERIDEDFHAIRTRSVGRFTMRESVKDVEAFKGLVAELTGLPRREAEFER